MTSFCKQQEAFAIGWLSDRTDFSAAEISNAAKANPEALAQLLEAEHQIWPGFRPVGELKIADVCRRFITLCADKHGNPLKDFKARGGYDEATHRLSWEVGSYKLTWDGDMLAKIIFRDGASVSVADEKISSDVITVTPIGTKLFKSGVLLAVTTTSFKVPCATCAKPDKHTAESQPNAAQRRRVRNTFFMMNTQHKPSPPSPTVLGRSAVRQAHVHLVGRYPGLRKQPLSAFPVACSRRPVAVWDRAKPREQFVRLTVAGAAQADLGRALG